MTALKKFKVSASTGNAKAQFYLGLMNDLGRGVTQDYAEAMRLYKLAAAQGHADAQSDLGVMYDNGQGVVQDYTRAHMWFNLAAVKGYSVAVKNRDIVAKRMTSQQISEAQNWQESAKHETLRTVIECQNY